MIQSSASLAAAIGLCVFSCVALRSSNVCLAQGANEKPAVLPLSPAHIPVPGQTTGKTFFATVEWEGKEYDAHEGTAVLMQVVADAGSDASRRAKALELLGRLRHRDATPQLVALYERFTEREERVKTIRCLISSEDPRGLPLFARILEHEEDEMVRLSAAVAMAQWNVRRGVAELIGIHDKCKDATSAHSYVCTGAANSFARLNTHRGWGFPQKRVREALLGRSDLDDDQRRQLYLNEIKNWWSQNKHRFPDWKPGDPLPAAPQQPPIPPGPESVLSLTAAFRPPPTIWPVAEEKEEVAWQGKRFSAREGVELLMKAALEPDGANERILAVHRLEYLGSQLRNTERIPQLLKLYEQLTDRSEKVGLLFCLARSKDLRVLPLFVEILETRKEEYLRLPAAYGLALWNERDGVRELIELLLVKQTETPIRYPGLIGDKAARLLSRLNYWKSWWAPKAVLQAAGEARAEVHDEALDSCHAELKKWFAENEHRFPDWKPGDPLPEPTKPDSKESRGE